MSRLLVLPLLALLTFAGPAPAQDTRPILRHLELQGVSVFSREDVLWLLDLHEGAPLPSPADAIAARLQDRYARDGYTEARAEGAFADGTLTLRVDEARIDDIELPGASEREAERLRARLSVKRGDVFNTRTIGKAVEALAGASGGALRPGSTSLQRRGGRNVLVLPIEWRRASTEITSNPAREDFFSPVDGFSPAIGVGTRIFDRSRFNDTYVAGFVEYKFGRDAAGWSLGGERPIFGAPKLFLGAEAHDVTASDDLWRLSTVEQSLVSMGFRQSYRDYYRRRGGQLWAVLRPGRDNEVSAAVRWDRHEPLETSTDFSLFRGDASFRPNPVTATRHVNAFVLGYTFDNRGLTGAGDRTTYTRHLMDSLFGFGVRRLPGIRVEWTSEIAGRGGLGGEAVFDRHILDTRGYLRLSRRQLVSGRTILGVSNGDLPPERLFALGGIGTVHGYAFKEAVGTGMALFNAEYQLDLVGGRPTHDPILSVLGFYDAGRVTGTLASRKDWLQGIGAGVGLGPLRIEFGFRADAIPRSRQILVRLRPAF